MAAEGARLTSFYVAAPLCTPSRAALMTGCYPKRIDMAYGSDFAVLLAADKKGLNPDEITIAEVLKSAGYKTGMFGKWHLGDQPEFLPTRQGFDEYFGIPYSHDIHPFHPEAETFQVPAAAVAGRRDGDRNGSRCRLPDQAYHGTRRQLHRSQQRRAVLSLRAAPDSSRAFACLSAVYGGCSRCDQSEVEAGEESSITERAGQLFRQAISEIDWSVGQILDALKKNGLDENTVVIFTSDNGPAIGQGRAAEGQEGQHVRRRHARADRHPLARQDPGGRCER